MNSQAEDLTNINLGSSIGVCSQGHAPAALSPGKNPVAHSIRGEIGPRGKVGKFTIREILLSQLGFEPRTA